jgi:hypothetical protein
MDPRRARLTSVPVFLMTKWIRYVCPLHPDVTLFYGEVEAELTKMIEDVEPLRMCPSCRRAYHPWECDTREDDRSP